MNESTGQTLVEIRISRWLSSFVYVVMCCEEFILRRSKFPKVFVFCSVLQRISQFDKLSMPIMSEIFFWPATFQNCLGNTLQHTAATATHCNTQLQLYHTAATVTHCCNIFFTRHFVAQNCLWKTHRTLLFLKGMCVSLFVLFKCAWKTRQAPG